MVCGCTSDHTTEEDARREVEQFTCTLDSSHQNARKRRLTAEDALLARANAVLKSKGKKIRKNPYVSGVIPPRVNYSMIWRSSEIDEDDDLSSLASRHGFTQD